jgi:hypothetical protein
LNHTIIEYFSNCILSNNKAQKEGGAIRFEYSSALLFDLSFFFLNTAGHGGALSIFVPGTTYFENITFE